jgi:ferredoxin, 2Fe-2S
MARVIFVIDGQPRTVECEPGALPYLRHGLPGSLLDIALNFAIPLEHVCGGSCACTTCHVIIRAGAENLSEMDDSEVDRLDTAWDVGPDSRLACQAIVRGDVVCEVPAYNRNYVQEGAGIRLGQPSAPAGGAGEAKR